MNIIPTDSVAYMAKRTIYMEDLLVVDWENAKEAWVSEGGSSGVIFVRFSDGSEREMVVVLKGTSKIAEEIFATTLASQLAIVRVPKFRLVKYTDHEWVLLKVGRNDEPLWDSESQFHRTNFST